MTGFVIDLQDDEGLRGLAKRWWLLAVLGAITAVLGALILIRPVAGVFALAVLIALALLVSGLSQIMTARRWQRTWIPLLWGALSLAAGAVAVIWPAISLFALALVIGIGLIVRGLVVIVANLGERPHLWGAWTIFGVLEVLVGAAAIIWPGITILVLSILIGIDLLLAGLMDLAIALKLRRLL